MAGGIADERGHGLDAVLVEHAVQQFLAAGEGFVPGGLAPLRIVGGTLADHRHADAVGVLVEATQRGALGADESVRPHIVAVGTDHLDVVLRVEMHLETAHALAQRALAKMHPGAIGFDPVHSADHSCWRVDSDFHGHPPRMRLLVC